MAFQQNGYALIPQVVTYDEWRNYLLTHGVNVDFRYGNQCWDSCALLWYQYGLRLQTGNGYAYGCWTIMRNQNGRPPFQLIYDKTQIKRGDVVVFNRVGSFSTGHIGYADENYNGSDRINILGQNQGQGTSSGTPSNIVVNSLGNFLGAFRNSNWQVPDPTPPTPESHKNRKFKWVLFNNRIKFNRK